MSSIQPGSDGTAKETSRAAAVPTRPEVVVLPVTNVDRAKAFYQNIGWRCDADFADDGVRLVQFTPSALNVLIILTGVISDQPDSRPITAWELESPETAWVWWWPATNSTRTAWP